jgi:hypothetical protein
MHHLGWRVVARSRTRALGSDKIWSREMEGPLYELIRDYQAARAATVGGPVLEFRAEALRHFALAHPDRCPEYMFADGRLQHAITQARAAGEILPPITGHRDEPLMLRIDRERAAAANEPSRRAPNSATGSAYSRLSASPRARARCDREWRCEWRC